MNLLNFNWTVQRIQLYKTAVFFYVYFIYFIYSVLLVYKLLDTSSGGQLKTKNGQKYIINHHRPNEGFYISKSHAILIAALIAIVMAAYAVLMYFLFASRYMQLKWLQL